MKTNQFRITGHDAVRITERDGVTLNCHANPIDDGGVITPLVGRQILRDDPALVYVDVTPRGWWDGQRVSDSPDGYNVSDYFGPSGEYLGPDDFGIEPTWDDAL